ncbi:MAG: FAD-binding oxidoreductase [Polyangiaceae bacterium]|nr:FAD-binding oxidoreductase [Polyangiaceae bacterium]
MNLPNPVASAEPSHGKVETADVVVIGAGSIGTPTALALAAEGLRVVVLDKQKSVGQGSNKAAIGGVRATHSDPSKIQLCKRSLEIFSTWKETFGHDIEWVTGGYLFPAYREQDETTLKNLLTTQHAYGLSIHWLQRDDLLKAAPDLNQNALRGGTFSPNDGHCSPLLALHALFDRAQTLGAIFRFEEPVTQVVHQNGKITGVRTHHSQIATTTVVNAAGVWSSDIGGLPPESDLPVKPDAHEAGITEAVAPFLGPLVVDIRPGPGSANCYFFQHKNGQVIFCLTPSPLIWGDDTRETSTFLPMAARRLLDVMPRLSALRVRRTWRGLYPMTPDGLPLVGFSTHVEGYFVAGGMCGQGFMLGPAVGELVARSILQKNTSEDLPILKALEPHRRLGGKAEQLR